jgi:hypothetical protein
MPLLSTRGAASARGFGLLGRVKAIADPFFNYVTMLLKGDGTNGGQNNTFLDSSTNNFTITRNGNTTQGSFSPYGPNWSNYFNGTTDYLTTAGNSAFDLGTGNFTVECWFNYATTPPAGSGYDYLWAVGGNNVNGLGLYVQGGVPKIWNGSNVLTTTGSISGNVWYHIAVVRSSGTLTVYLNGVSIGSVSFSSNLSGGGSAGFNIAKWQNIPDPEFFNGYISNFRVVKGTAVYTANFTPSTTPLTAISGTSLLTCADNRFIDDSTNNFTITAVGTPSVQRFSPFAPPAEYSAATIGGSGYFDGAGDYLNTGTTAALDLDGTNYTIEAWVYLDGTKGTNTLLFADPYYVLGISLSRTGAGDTYIYTGDGGNWTGVPLIISSSGLPLRCWSHFALVKTSTTMTIYHNGVNVGSNSQDWRFPSGFNGRMFVGAINDATEFFGGYISGLRITRSALYTSNFTPSTTPLTQSGSLLLNFTNGTIFDNAMMNDLETVGNAQISTSVVKFGTGSISLDGTGDYLDSGGSTVNFVFGTGDFTIEFWMYLNSTTQGHPIDFRPSSVNGAYPTLYITSNTLIYFVDSSNRITSSSLSTSTWYHVAISRSGTSTKMFINGTQNGSTYTDSTNYLCKANGPRIGANDGGTGGVNGYIDDLRITKGVARYTTTFTPPTQAFPNF